MSRAQPSTDPIDRFASVAKQFRSWAVNEAPTQEDDLLRVCQLLADLVAAGCALGWSAGEPSELHCEPKEIELVKARAAHLPLQYYSEVFDTLSVPAEEPVTGDLVDDLADIYADVAPGLTHYERGQRQEAADHWRFWFAAHWGEHATSALRAAWSFLAERRPRTAVLGS